MEIAQMVFPGFRFGVDDPAYAEALVEKGVGGFCLYSGRAVPPAGSPPNRRPCPEAGEISRFTKYLQSKAKIPLLFCADYEDGPGAMVKGGTMLPSNMAVGACADRELARTKGEITAKEAKAMGVDWVLAPVLDLAVEPENPIVNARSFGSSPGLVSEMAKAYMEGLSRQGVLSCIKHFPGHGRTRVDSHLDLPVLEVPKEELLESDIRPYRELAHLADSVMLGHLLVPFLDGRFPASFSERVAGSLLRGELGFKGLVVTDAISMGAVSGRFPLRETAVSALKAGVDILLVPEDPDSLLDILFEACNSGDIPEGNVRSAYERIMAAKKRCGLFEPRESGSVPLEPLPGGQGPLERRRRDGPQVPGALRPAGDLKVVGCAEHRMKSERMAESGAAWLPGAALRKPFLNPGDTLFYGELESVAGKGGEGWQGRDFLDEIGKSRVSLKPYEPGCKGKIVFGVFCSPRAYSGKISLERESLMKIAQASAGNPVAVVSFGSPFIFGQIKKMSAGLCVFSDCPASQKAAAKALLGSLACKAKMPVQI